nr:Chain C, PBP4 [Staphylococcus aureus subsp. aureus COL]
NRLFRKR